MLEENITLCYFMGDMVALRLVLDAHESYAISSTGLENRILQLLTNFKYFNLAENYCAELLIEVQIFGERCLCITLCHKKQRCSCEQLIMTCR